MQAVTNGVRDFVKTYSIRYYFLNIYPKIENPLFFVIILLKGADNV